MDFLTLVRVFFSCFAVLGSMLNSLWLSPVKICTVLPYFAGAGRSTETPIFSGQLLETDISLGVFISIIMQMYICFTDRGVILGNGENHFYR